MSLSQSPTTAAASQPVTLAHLIATHPAGHSFLTWLDSVRVTGVTVDGVDWEPIPVPEVSESDFGAFDAAVRS